MTAIAFINGAYFRNIEHYVYAGEIFYNNFKHIVRGSGNDNLLSTMWSIGAKLKATEETIKKAISLGITDLTIVNSLNAIKDFTDGIIKPKQEGTINFMKYFNSVKDKIKVTIRRPENDAETKKLKQVLETARDSLGL